MLPGNFHFVWYVTHSAYTWLKHPFGLVWGHAHIKNRLDGTLNFPKDLFNSIRKKLITTSPSNKTSFLVGVCSCQHVFNI